MTAASIIATLIVANIAASAAILAVLALREPVRRLAGARVAYMVWLIVPAAILASFIPARVVLIPAPPTPAAIEMPAAPPPEVRGDGPAIAPMPGLPGLPSLNVEPRIHRADITIDWTSALAVIWALGAFAALAWLVATQYAAVKSLGPLTRVSPNTFRAARSALGPAVVGVLAPRIVLPADFEQTYDEAERKVVLAHEEAHLRDRHTAAKALTHALACLSWFNPLAWIAVRAVAMDQELACDDAVAARYPRDRRVYAEVLVKAQSGLRAPLGCYWPVNAASKLKTRIARLGAAAPSPRQRLIGVSAVALLAVAAGCTAWSAKPAEERIALPAGPPSMLADLSDYITVHGDVIRADGDTVWVKADRVSRKGGDPKRNTAVWRLSLDALVRGAPLERPSSVGPDRIFHTPTDGHDHGPKIGDVAFFNGYALADTCKPECAGFIISIWNMKTGPDGWPNDPRRQNASFISWGETSVFGRIIRLEDSPTPSLLVQASASTGANGKVVGDDKVWRLDASELVEKISPDRRKAYVDGFNTGVADAPEKEAVFTVSRTADHACNPECKAHLETMKYLEPGESYAGTWRGQAVVKPVYSASDRPAPQRGPASAPADYDTKDTVYIRGQVERIEFRDTSYVLFVRSEAYGRDPYALATIKSDLFELSPINDFGDPENRKSITASMTNKKLDVWAWRASDKSCAPACRVYTREIFERDATGEISQVGFGGLKGGTILEEIADRSSPLTLKGTVIKFDNTIESASPHGLLWIESTSVDPASVGGAAPKTVWRVAGFPQNVITANFWVGREVTINGFMAKDERCRTSSFTGEQCFMIGKQIF